MTDEQRRGIDAARGLGPVVVDYFGRGLLRLDEAVSIGVMEATASSQYCPK